MSLEEAWLAQKVETEVCQWEQWFDENREFKESDFWFEL